MVSLHLQRCKIVDVESGAFSGMKGLIYLYLSENDLTTLNGDAFKGLVNAKPGSKKLLLKIFFLLFHSTYLAMVLIHRSPSADLPPPGEEPLLNLS